MGKLHSLRRAILRDPEKWKDAKYAVKHKDGWHPGTGIRMWWPPIHTYRNFIKSVLKNMTK